MEGLNMVWLYVATAGAGALLGLLRLRVPAIVWGSVVLMAITIPLVALGHWPPLETVINLLLLLPTLQFSYLAALLLSSATRVASRDRVDASTRRM